MVRETYENIKNGMEVRQNLSRLRRELKEEGSKQALLFYLEGNYGEIQRLLLDEDAKTRKNTALLLGDLGDKKLLPSLYEAYEKETTLFVKSAYLAAMKEFDYREYLPSLRRRMDELLGMDIREEEKKHRNEEIRALSDLLVMIDGIKAHKFIGYDAMSQLILLTNRNFQDIALKQVERAYGGGADACKDLKEFNAGVMVTVDNLNPVLKLRTYEELLFSVKGMKTCPFEPDKAGERIMAAGFLEFLEERHNGPAPFYFRIECKSRQPLDKRSIFSKKLAAGLESRSGRRLINTTSNYEVELRMIENKSGTWNVLVKLYTLKDCRFTYRLEALPVSIKPVNAALVMALCGDYLKENAKVLDPFCGTGTMLIERHKYKKADTMYGIDIYGKAIEKAKVNTEEARQIIHYINRDFFDFSHEYLFDEIITNMPSVQGRKTEDEVFGIYKRFFKKAGSHLKDQGVIILYSHNRNMVGTLALSMNYKIVKEWEISKKEGTYVYVIKKQKERRE